jgi:type I restriction enzyme S subunit
MNVRECNRIALLPLELQPHQVLKRGDILVSMTGNVGRVCIVSEEKLLLNQRVGKLVPTGVNPEFLFALLSQRKFISDMMLSAKGGAQGNLSISDICSYSFGIPRSLPEQTAIATALSDVDSEIESLETKLSKTRQIKQGMMQELLTGRIRLV